MIFATERLLFRRLEPRDFDALFRMYSDPEVRKFFPDGTLDAEQTREELEWFLAGHPEDARLGLWATELKLSGQFVGRSGLLPWQIDGVREIEIAYMIDKAHWRHGYGSEAAKGLVKHAFEVTDASRLIALTDPLHEATHRTARSAGLEYWKDVLLDGIKSAVYRIDRS